MYDLILQELVEPGTPKRFIGNKCKCRYCGTVNTTDFGRRDNAHAFPAALGNRILFALNECKACNGKFSIYEDALVKAVGPFLTLGGVQGRNGVRQTGRTVSKSKIRHSVDVNGRHLSFVAEGNPRELLTVNQSTSDLTLRMPVEGDPFVPLYAYKALLKIALSLLPETELPKFTKAMACLAIPDKIPTAPLLQVGFSYAFVGNAPQVIAGSLLRRSDDSVPCPYMVFIFAAGSVCFQIWVKSDDADAHVPDKVKLQLQYVAQLPKPEGGYFPVRFCDPIQFDWKGKELILQPFEAFNLRFNSLTAEGSLTPALRK